MEKTQLNYCRVLNKILDIEFQDLTLKVKEKNDVKQIINNVSGKFKSGELTAIMGPSGAGKTSLLNILTGYQVSGVQGTIKCGRRGAHKTTALQYRKHSCYILQDDHLAPYFTVYEIMSIAARLKLKDATEKSVRFLIDDILNTLGLLNTKNTSCMNLSGGQRKRLSIALELIDNPPIMFLDEPTTGLDSCSCSQCVMMLKSLAREGRTIICTIHQPSAPVYAMFDHVYVLAQGRCVYQGAAFNTVPYLSSLGFQCPQYHNPADYLLEVTSGEYGQCTDLLAIAAVEDKWRYSITAPKQLEEKNEKTDLMITNEPVYPDDNIDNDTIKRPTEWQRFRVLMYRQFLHLYRDWTISQLKFLLHLLVGIFLGITFQRCGLDASKTINNLSFFMVGVVYLAYTALMPAALKFPSEMSILKKEYFNNWYKLRTYYAAFLMADIPLQIIFTMAYTCTSYFISSQPFEINRFLMVLGIQSLVTIVSSSIGLTFGTVANPINGTFLGAIWTALMFSVAGFLCLFPHMSKAMYFVSYISYMSFAMEGLLQAVYGYKRGTLICPDDVEYCLHTSSKELLQDIGMDRQNYWIDVVYLLGSILIWRSLAYCSLKRNLRNC